jgi:farnesyl diphosphate synthase
MAVAGMRRWPQYGVVMAFSERLAEAARLVEVRLAARLAALDGVPERLAAAMRHAVLAGGKRLRPFLVIESARLFAVAPERACDTAAALELVHCYSLAHDDLPAMDNDEHRRGQPTVWKAYDEWTAILVGDALLTLAFELLAEQDASPEIRAVLVATLARAAGAAGMAGGQVLDLEAGKLGRPECPDLDHIHRLQAMKTGALIAFGCEAGAILGRAGAEQRAALRCYGEALGLAFQISDDLLDVEGDAALLGKAIAKDAAAGKATLVALMGADAARARLTEVAEAGIAALASFGARAETLIEAMWFVARRNR